MIKSGVLAVIVLLSVTSVVFSLNLAEWKYLAEVNVADSNEWYCKRCKVVVEKPLYKRNGEVRCPFCEEKGDPWFHVNQLFSFHESIQCWLRKCLRYKM